MTDSIDVSIDDVLREMDSQTKMGWELAHQKAVNKVLIRKLAEQENMRASDGPTQ